MTHTQPTPGATRAAELIVNEDYSTNTIARIIDEETHCAEMLAFIETVADGDFPNFVSTIQTEAFELLKKVRG